MGEQQADTEQETVLATFWQKARQEQAKGNDIQARAWLEGIVELDDSSVDAWLELARMIPDPRERMQCFAKVLQLSPGHEEARAGLRRARRQL